MTNRSKQKGTAWETAVVTWLREHGFPYAERRTLAGVNDKGDVSGLPGVVLECKSCATLQLPAWLRELEVEMANADVQVGAVVIKKKGSTKVDDAYAVMPMHVLTRLLEDR